MGITEKEKGAKRLLIRLRREGPLWGAFSLGRVGLPDDIGGVIASLLSEENRWGNAQRIEASGGMFLEFYEQQTP